MTKREAQEAEAEFLIKSQNEASVSATSFNQLIDLFIENRSTRVKDTTMYGYKNKRPYLDPIANVKLKDFNIDVYEHGDDILVVVIFLLVIKMISINF